jgi:hypothetical protein
MARKSKNQRREDQRKRQAGIRDKARLNRRPGRDDLARMLLWLAIRDGHMEAAKIGHRGALDMLCGVLARHLEKQGFDPEETEDVFNMLEDKYKTDAYPGRIKRHLGLSGPNAVPGCGY